MTVKRYAGDKMVGLSTDTKPTNVPDGATFYESDTPALYIKVGGSWVQINTGGGGGGGVSATGTPLNDQLAVWTSASSIEGDPNLTWDGTQMTVTGDVEANEFIGDLRGAVRFKAQAGEALAKGDAVYISGVSGQTPIVSKADADDAAKMPAFGLVTAATGLGNPCEVVTFGTFIEYDTSTPGWSLGDTLYISTTPGQLSNTAPTGESGLIQNIGKVQRVDTTDGRIKVGGAGRTNATPNLNEGRIFAGNASNQAVATDTLYVDIANSRIGINETSPTAALHIGGTGTIKYGTGPLTELVSHSNASYINLDGQSLAAFRRSGGDSQYFHVNGHIGLGFPTVADVRIYKDAADQLALRRNLNPQTFSIYNTYTDASNYERATFEWDSNTFVISPQGLGTGSTARALKINFGTTGTNGGNNYITGGVNEIQIAAGGAPYLVVGVSEWKVGQWNGLPLTIGTKSQSGVTDRNAQPIVLDVAGGSGAGTAGYFAIKTAPSLTTGTTGHTSVERLRIDGDGNVGIGTSNPIHTLDVVGNARIASTTLDPDSPALSFYWDNYGLSADSNGSTTFVINNSIKAMVGYGVVVGSDQPVGWGTTTTTANIFVRDLELWRDAAGTLAQRNGTNAQAFNIYNTYTDASNYERGYIRWVSNVLNIGTEGAGTGSDRSVYLKAFTGYLGNGGINVNNQGLANAGLMTFHETNTAANIQVTTKSTDSATRQFSITGQAANASAVTNIDGGDLKLQGGAPVSTGSYGDVLLNPDGGNVGIGTSSPTSPLHVIGNATISSTANIGQISLNGTRTITSNTGNATMRLRALGRTTAGAAHIIGDTANNVMSNSSGDTVNLSIDNTVNQTGTAGHTDVLINRTQTAVGSGNQYLLDAQVGGTSYFKIGNDGKFGRMNNLYSAWTSAQNTIEMGGNGLRIYAYGQEIAGCYGPTTKFHVGRYTGGSYTFLKSETTGTLALEHGTTATGLHLYNTYTDASNYERAFLDWSTGVFQIGTEALGTGSTRRIEFVTTGAVRAGIDTSGHSFITVGRRLYFGGNTSGVYFYQLSNGLEIGGGNIQGSDTQPLVDITGTWNTTGATSGITLDVTDTASASTSTLLDLKVGTASKFKVDKSGFITATRFSTGNGYMWHNNNGAFLRISDSYLYSPNTGGNVWEVRNGTNAQEFRIFNTYTNDTNYERATLKWDTNVFKLSSEALGTGSLREIEVFAATKTTFKSNNGAGYLELSGANTPYFTAFQSTGRRAAYGPLNLTFYDAAATNPVQLGKTETVTTTTTTATTIVSFATSFKGAKLVVQAADTVTGERQMSEILLVHDGTTVTLTEYGIIYTNASLATYTASISGGNVIVNATSASTNSTTYKVMETLI